MHNNRLLWGSLRIAAFPIAFFIFLSCNANSGVDRNEQKEENSASVSYRKLNVKDFHAKGDSQSDDTKSIQAAINAAEKGDTIFIPAGIYKVKTLILKSDINLVGVGLLKQYLLVDTQNFNRAMQNSSAPLFFGRNIHRVHLTFYASTLNEGLYISNSSDIKITYTKIEGNPKKLHAFPGMLFYDCDSIQVSNSIVRNYGAPRQSAKNYQAGTGIRFLSCQNILIESNKISHNGENGIFMHSSGRARIHHNYIAHNGMSAIQIGFGRTKSEVNFSITNNVLEHNAADAIDINNKITTEPFPIACSIRNNKSFQNGFVNNESTVDGSGLATLINVSDVHVLNNRSQKSNRPALYLEDCGTILAEGNMSDNKVEIVHTFDRITLRNNTFDALTVLTNTKGNSLSLSGNTLRTLLLPNGISIDSLTLKKNKLTNANLNFNMQGHILLEANDIHTDNNTSALLLVKLNSARIVANNITSTGNFAVMIRRMAQRVVLEENDIRSVNACIYDDGAAQLTLLSNKLTSLPGGVLNRTLMSKEPNNLRIKGNIHKGGASDNSIRFEGTGTAFVANEQILSGYVDYGQVTIKEF